MSSGWKSRATLSHGEAQKGKGKATQGSLPRKVSVQRWNTFSIIAGTT